MSDIASSFYKLVEDRRSIRRFRKTPVSDRVLQRVLNAGIRAPSAHNHQPWRFVILRDLQTRENLARRMGERLWTDLERENLDPLTIQKDVDRSIARIVGAYVGIIMCADRATMDPHLGDKRSHAEYLMAVQGVAMAGENILLAAQAEGLGACWICAPLFVPELVRAELALPTTWEPQGMILLGYPADPGRARSRRLLAEVSIWR